MKRHLITFALLAVLVPSALLAQDELTLDSLQDLITGLDERITAIEEMFADPWSPDIVYTDDGICQSPLHARYKDYSWMVEAVHQETADAYRAQFGASIDPDDADLVSLSFSVDGSEAYLGYHISGKTVVETWKHCKYLGHSDWTD